MTPTRLGSPEPHTYDWHKMRHGGLGASDAAAVLGISPWLSPFSLFWQKIAEPVDDDMTEPQLWGTLLEPVIVDRFRTLHPEFTVTDGRGMYADPDRPYVRATPDGLVYETGADGGMPVALLEAKTGDPRWAHDWGTPGSADVPDHYWCQVQQQMHVMDLDVTYLVVLLGGKDYREYQVPRDQAFIDGTLLPALAEFWDRVTRMDAPPVDAMDSTTTTLRGLHPDVEDIEVEVDADVAQAWIDAQHAVKAADAMKALAVNRMLDAIGDGRYAVHEQVRLATRIVSNVARIDTKALRAEMPDVAEKFTRTTRTASLRSLLKDEG